MSKWRDASVGECFDLENGFAFKSSDFRDKGVPVIKIKNVKAGHFSSHEFDFVDPSFVSLRPSKVARRGDLLISMSGNRHDGSPETWVGKVAPFRSDAPHLINQRVGALRLKAGTDVDVAFAGYMLSSWSYQQHFIAVATSSGGQANLSPAQILSVRMQLPDIRSQRAIGELLGFLDDKIALNRQMNETLEAMAQAIFRDWFIDFGPTRRKTECATDPLEIMGGLITDAERAQQLADLFPASFGDKGLPKGWKAGVLGDLAKSAGATVDPSSIDPEMPYIGLEHMPRKSIALAEWEAASKVSSTKAKFERGQVLFGKLRPYFHKVGVAPVDGVCSTDIVVLDAQAEGNRPLIAALVSTEEFVAFTDQGSTGTKMPRTSWANMKRYEVAVSDGAVSGAYGSIAGPLLDGIVSNIHENRTLAATRDLLLPKLMSGEIRLQEADEVLEAAQ